ncbi:hypothetical protein [Aestuariivita boseongensis]|uniref:hypothetical protein n=1 Tax=Aestuariivita boseongensis TaxID=1470562 RepID=UPI00155DAA5D|nr:hypothetical protein [Aestuariivita boseongensis]
MTVRSRFIKSVVAAAKSNETEMPWARGSARRKMILRRSAPVALTPRGKVASA